LAAPRGKIVAHAKSGGAWWRFVAGSRWLKETKDNAGFFDSMNT
jgi:hypothetical protein